MLARFRQFITGSFLKKVFILAILLIPCAALYNPAFENDTYWLLNTGRYILNNGFPHIEPFTFHEGLQFTAQQWLTTVIFYLLYSKLGMNSLFVTGILFYFLICATIYVLSIRLSEKNRVVSTVITLMACFYLMGYMVPRPQMFSILIFALEVYILEMYVKSKKLLYVVCIPVLSLLLVNLHAAMWIFFFILMMPYIIDGMSFNIKIIRSEGYGCIKLVLALLVSIAAGFLNPYGLKNMLYVFSSYGNDMLLKSVNEMKSPDFKSPFGMTIYVLLLLVTLVYIKFKGQGRLRYLLISIGTAYMALSSVRSLPIFIVCSMPLIAFHIKDVRFNLSSMAGKKLLIGALALLVTVCIGIAVIREQNLADSESEFTPVAAVEYIKKNIDTDKMKLYCEYETGGYIEFSGIKPFIDSRGEVFLKSINGKSDIAEDYLRVSKGLVHYRQFVSQYGFTHLLVSRGTSLNVYIKEDITYRKRFEDKRFVLYEKIK